MRWLLGRRRRSYMRASWLRAGLTIAAAASLALAGCAESNRQEESPDKLIFGTAGDPKVFDPALASDGESLRVSRQVFETLVQPLPGGAEIVPGLAASWEPDASGLVWTFKLQQGVKFHDGSDFN